MKSFQAQFLFCQPLMFCTASALCKTGCAILPFSPHGSQRGIMFHLCLVCLCPPTAATMDTMYWETVNMKILEIMKK